jgi:hypothetical protein
MTGPTARPWSVTRDGCLYARFYPINNFNEIERLAAHVNSIT